MKPQGPFNIKFTKTLVDVVTLLSPFLHAKTHQEIHGIHAISKITDAWCLCGPKIHGAGSHNALDLAAFFQFLHQR